LPSDTSFTIMLLAYLVNSRAGNWRYIAGIENATSLSSAYKVIGWNNSDQMEISSDGGAAAFSAAPATSKYFWCALTCSTTGANSLKGYWKYLLPSDGTTLYTAQATSNAFTEAAMMLGNDSYDEWVDARLLCAKVWDTELTQTEVTTEMGQLLPVKSASLHAFYPFFLTSSLRLLDYSSNARTLTAGGTLTDEVGAPIQWRYKPQPSFIIPGGTLFEQSAAGALSMGGVMSKQTGKTIAGNQIMSGAISRMVSKTMSGIVGISGLLDSALVKLQSIAGALSMSGATSKQTGKAVAGNQIMSGAISRMIGKTMSGIVGISGQTLKEIAKQLSGSLDVSGVLNSVLVVIMNVAGFLDASGSVVKETKKQIEGNVILVGVVIKSIAKFVSGVLELVGALINRLLGVEAPPSRTLIVQAEKREVAENGVYNYSSNETENRSIAAGKEGRAFAGIMEKRTYPVNK